MPGRAESASSISLDTPFGYLLSYINIKCCSNLTLSCDLMLAFDAFDQDEIWSVKLSIYIDTEYIFALVFKT